MPRTAVTHFRTRQDFHPLISRLLRALHGVQAACLGSGHTEQGKARLHCSLPSPRLFHPIPAVSWCTALLPSCGTFPCARRAQAQRFHLHLPPFSDRCPKKGPCAHSSVPDLTPWLQLLQDRHHFHLVHLTASVHTGLRKFNPPPPPKHARNRPLNCPFLRQNSKREQLVLRALWLTINAKTELRLLIPKKCLQKCYMKCYSFVLMLFCNRRKTLPLSFYRNKIFFQFFYSNFNFS